MKKILIDMGDIVWVNTMSGQMLVDIVWRVSKPNGELKYVGKNVFDRDHNVVFSDQDVIKIVIRPQEDQNHDQ